MENNDNKELNSVSPTDINQQNSDTHSEYKINTIKVEEYIESKRIEQNLPFAVIAGFIAMIIGAVLWSVVSVSTGYQIGYMAVAVGFIVGYVVRYTGKGIDPIFGIIGAAFSLLGCLLGNLGAMVGFISQEYHISYTEVMAEINMSNLFQLVFLDFGVMDLLFYGLALYEGYKFSFRKFTEDELTKHVLNKSKID